MQLVSILNASYEVPATANGDSYMPIVTPNGRYVLFASVANNLVMTNSDGTVTGGPRHWLDVYLRDRLEGTTTLVSDNLAGVCGDGNSYPTGLSTNGQFALFESSATDLVTNDVNFANNVYVRDVVNNITMLVSVNTNSVSGNGNSHSSVMTPDGRFVAFASEANDLVPSDTNGITDVFLRDLQAGTTALISEGAQADNSIPYYPWSSISDSPVITPDGRYVAFFSSATNLIPGVNTAGEVYVRDTVADTMLWASTNARSLFQSIYGTANELSCNESISTNGQFVAFEACLNNSYQTVNNINGIILRNNLLTGQTDIIYTNAYVPPTATHADFNLLSMTPDGRFVAFVANDAANDGNSVVNLWDADTETNTPISVDRITGLPVIGFCNALIINSTGQYLAFLCSGTNLTTNAVVSTNLYLRDLQAGNTYLIDVGTNGNGVGLDASSTFSMADDGGMVAFDSSSANLVSGDLNRNNDVFAYNLSAGTTELISKPAYPSESPNGLNEIFSTCISTNGRYVAFASDANNLTANDTNIFRDVYVSDLLLGSNILVSVGTNGYAANGVSTQPSISGDGHFVAFASYAVNLVTGETNKVEHVFRRDLVARTNALVSASTNGSFGNNNSYSPIISSDGRYVLFHSLAQNLATGIPTSIENLFLRDMQSRTNNALTTNGVVSASMTPDGQSVAFIGVNKVGSVTNLYVWNAPSAKLSYTNLSIPPALTNVSISADGRWIAYTTRTSLEAYDLIGESNYLIGTALLDSRSGMQFDGSDRYLVFATKSKLAPADTNGTYDVYVHDFQLGANLLVSLSFNSTNAANGPSYLPVISPDGRYVAYRSLAGNIVPNSGTNIGNVFVYDLSNNATMLMSVNQAGTAAANGWSTAPVFSGDGSTLAFESYASDLLGPAFNEYSSIYAFGLTNFPMASGTGGGAGGGSTGTNSGVFARLVFPPGTQYPQLTWPLGSGQTYQVQFENDLSGTNWQPVNSSIVFIGGTAEIQDPSPLATNRFYRIVLY